MLTEFKWLRKESNETRQKKKTPRCIKWRGNFWVVCETVGFSSMELVTASDVSSSF